MYERCLKIKEEINKTSARLSGRINEIVNSDRCCCFLKSVMYCTQCHVCRSKNGGSTSHSCVQKKFSSLFSWVTPSKSDKQIEAIVKCVEGENSGKGTTGSISFKENKEFASKICELRLALSGKKEPN